MERINWLGVVFALLIVCAMVTFLVVKGHADSLTIVVTSVCAIVLTVVNVLRGKTTPPKEGGSS